LPPKVGAVRLRLRDCPPAPHDKVHVDQGDHSPTTQSVAHACSLQARTDTLLGQAVPPKNARPHVPNFCCCLAA
jgi:hypothetical protein